MELTSGSRSERGPRPLNQDHVKARPDLGLFVVADGMGGHNAGEVASQMAADTIVAFIEETSAASDITWPYDMDPTKSVDANRLGTAVRLANRTVFFESSSKEACRGMGTTVVAALVRGSRVALASVGDSRIYRWRGGLLERLTNDDTWLTAVFGTADRELQDSAHPLRHVLTSVVGTRDDIRPTLREEELSPGDTFVLCSDGVHGRLDAASIAEVLASHPTAAAAAGALVDEALKLGTTDNCTALVFQAR
jgi:protein phosphatase